MSVIKLYKAGFETYISCTGVSFIHIEWALNYYNKSGYSYLNFLFSNKNVEVVYDNEIVEVLELQLKSK